MAIHRLRWYSFPCSHSHFSQAGFLRRQLWESLAAHVCLISFVLWMFQCSIMLGTRICLVLASRSIARGGSVAGSPKVHGGDCLIRLHTMTVLLDFTRCSPSCSSYIRRTFVRLSCTYNQLTHSHQQMYRGVDALPATIKDGIEMFGELLISSSPQSSIKGYKFLRTQRTKCVGCPHLTIM